MYARDISVGQVTEIIVVPTEDSSFGTILQPGAYVELRRLSSIDEIALSIGGNHWSVTGLDTEQQRRLEDVVTRSLPHICVLTAAKPKNNPAQRAVVSVREFAQEYSLGSETIDIYISDAAFEDLGKLASRQETATRADLLKWITDSTVITDTASPAIIISGIHEGSFLAIADGFRLYGRSVAADIKRIDGNFYVTRLIRHPRVSPETGGTLLYATVQFHDVSAAAKLEAEGSQVLEAIIARSNGSYLHVWREYNQLEQQLLLGKAREVGWIEYDGCQLHEDGWRLSIKTKPQEFGKWRKRLDIAEEEPLEISGSLPSDLDHREYRQDSDANERTLAVYCADDDSNPRQLFVKPLDPDEHGEPPTKGYVYISLTGDRVRLTRRQMAWDMIRQGKTPIPGLGLLLENSERFVSRGFKRRIIRKSEIRRAFDDEPTPSQYRAIEIAINTPDIALIQGPPGTGKTRVIAALNQLIANEKAKERYGFGRTLLTSYQHDAVEHVASVTQVYGLPAVKIGRRNRTDRDFDAIESWREAKLRELTDALLPSVQTPVRIVHETAQKLLLGYMKSPGTLDETARNLRMLYSEAASYLEPSTCQDLTKLAQQFERPHHAKHTDSDTRLLEKYARALRTDKASFRDDGPKSAHKLLLQLSQSPLLSDGDTQLLEAASTWLSDEAPDFLGDLEILQNRLLDTLDQPRQLDEVELRNADVERVLTQVINGLHERVHETLENTELLVWKFMQDLESDPGGIRDALLHYAVALAATCQQSAGKKMERLFESRIEFETVIVDEAARSNPLDLLIPMTHAGRRIVLVGDHRQLPHMLEPQVERELEHSGKAAQDALSRSLFERLFLHMRALEGLDGIQRTVTLDQQFRMHPILGQFVSDTFYGQYDESFQSPLPAEQFMHAVEPYEQRVGVWKSVPLQLGSEQGGQSKFRPVEARRIAEEAKRILDSQQNISVGVITFYSAQVRMILKEMYRLELAIKTEDGYQLVDEYAQLEGRERLRVGTVDAFQGKEFDVVLLSMTRSNEIPAALDNRYAQRRKFGFLTLENRLCVAMSRQKKLLIVFGDDEMIHHEAAKEAIPSLVAFYELCGGEYGVRLPA